MLTILTRADILLPTRAVKLMTTNLIHDNIAARKCSIHVLSCILKQLKRPHLKIELMQEDHVQVPGDRSGNAWLCYDKDKVPKNEQDWNEQKYVHKTHYGYYKWPQKMVIYAPSNQQPNLSRSLEEMNPQEQEIYKFFHNTSNIDKLIEFLSLEEAKGMDLFDARRFLMFKGLFRNYGDAFMPNFQTHLQRLVEQDHESAHRCAAEIIAGKHLFSFAVNKNRNLGHIK